MKMIRLAYPDLEFREVRSQLKQVIDSGWLTKGPKTKELEDALSRYLNVKYAVAVSSGTAALHLSLLSLGIGPGDEVIVPDFTFPATANAVELCGARAILAGIELNNFNIDPADLERKLRPDTKGVIVTHMFGTPARIDEIRKVLEGTSCLLIEDAAHAHGATYQGRLCGTLGDAAFFSFDQVKPLSTFGGGMAVTNDDAIAARIREKLEEHPPVRHRLSKAIMGYIEHGMINSPLFDLIIRLTRFQWIRNSIGALYRKLDRRPKNSNLRLSLQQAYLGYRQLDHLEQRLSQRRANADFLRKKLYPLIPQHIPDQCTSTFYKFTALSPVDSEIIKKKLMQKGIDVGIKDDINYPCYEALGLAPDDFPGTKQVYKRLVELPGYETLTPNKLEKIAQEISELF